MLATQRAIVAGSRVGVGLDALMHAYRETNDELMARYQLQRDAVARGPGPDPSPRGELGELWMQRNDLRGYVLLGDPAARLAVVGGRASPRMAETSELDARDLQAITVRSTRAPVEPIPAPPIAVPEPAPSNPRPSNLRLRIATRGITATPIAHRITEPVQSRQSPSPSHANHSHPNHRAWNHRQSNHTR
jgi:hypothetical protein